MSLGMVSTLQDIVLSPSLPPKGLIIVKTKPPAALTRLVFSKGHLVALSVLGWAPSSSLRLSSAQEGTIYQEWALSDLGTEALFGSTVKAETSSTQKGAQW